MPRLPHPRATYQLALTLAVTFFLAALTWIIPSRSFDRITRHSEVKEKSSDGIIASSREEKETFLPTASPATTKPDEAARIRLNKSYGKLPLSFEANQGQTDQQVKFLSRGNGYSLFLAPTEMVMKLSRPLVHSKKDRDKAGLRTESRSGANVSAVLRMRLEGADPQARVTGLDELSCKSNYFIGNDPHKWRTDISNYGKVKYENAYPGIDVVYYGSQSQLEYDFIVAPGADPNFIKLNFEGAQQINLDRHGDLVLRVGQEVEVRQHKPKVYQEIDGNRREVDGRYALRSKNEIGFEIAAYDHSKPLVIDPVISGYSTYFGGSVYSDVGLGIAVDTLGRAYITGIAASPDFPSTTGTRQDTNYGDVFVARLSADGSKLEYSTLIGGIYEDDGYGIAVDSSGNAYVTGQTNSPDFPPLNAYKSARGSSDLKLADAFAIKLDADGSLIYSTYLGGSGDDVGNSIAVDANGSFYVSGYTASGNFPVRNSFQSNLNGVRNAFLTKFKADGSDLLYSTYFGGNYFETGTGVAVDKYGKAYITGLARSSDIFTTPGAFQTSGRGFVAKFDTNAFGRESLVYSTYTNNNDRGIAVDASGNAYVGGDYTVTKLNASGSDAIFSVDTDGSIESVALDSAGNAYVTGWTNYCGLATTPDAFQPTCGRGGDAFMMKLKASDGAVVYSTYLGGTDWDLGFGIAVDGNGAAYVTGEATNGFPTTPGAYQPVGPQRRYASTGFVTKLALAPPPSPPLIFIPGIAGSYLVDKNTNKNLWPGGVFTDHNALSLNSPNSNIIATDAIRTYLVPIVPDVYHPYSAYESLLGMLTKSGGYHEYQVKNDPALRTTAKCDTTQKDSNPNLFVFAYDWRKSNEKNAVALKDYVGCVQQFYSGTKVNILAHSMGGLLARRYILDNPGTHNVDKLITIASPWLGAPKGIHVLETGKFPPVTPLLVLADTLKDLRVCLKS